MYSWIWRKLPLGVPGKVIGSLLLAGGVAALLWFVAFPRLSEFMTPTQSTINDDDGGGGGDSDGGGGDDDSDRVTDNPSDFDLESSPTDGESS